MIKSNKAITLIALVITIVVLIILAAVAINLSLGNNGIFKRAKSATEQYSNAQIQEGDEIETFSNSIDGMISARTGANINMTSPKLLVSAALPGTSSGSRAAGTYRASSDSYNKTNESIFDNYLTFQKDVGWTVKKSGWYFLRASTTCYGSTSTVVDASIYVYLNGVVLDYSGNRAHQGNIERLQLHPTFYFEENDVIDFYYTTSTVSTWNDASFFIYTMTN